MSSTLDIDWTPFAGGDYIGKTLPQLLFVDPDHFFYLYRANANLLRDIRWQADLIADRAKAIAIPSVDGTRRVAEYLLDSSNRQRFGGVVLIHENQQLPAQFHSKARRDVFDLSLPRMVAPHDRQAGKFLVRQIKEYVLGNPSLRMTKQLCEEFFNDSQRFQRFAIPRGPSW